MTNTPIAVFSLHASRPFGELVAARLGVSLSAHEEREFADGEHKVRALVNVRGQDVYVIQSLYSDAAQSVNDKLCRLLFFLGALRDASAARVTAVIPYLAYARKDRKTQPRDPVTTRYVAALFEAVGIDRIITLDVHNLAAFQNAFRCHTEHLEARNLFVDYLSPILRENRRVALVSPDIGGVKRAERFRASLELALQRELSMAYFEKARARGVVNFGRLCGEVADCSVVIVDDVISTGSTLVHAAQECRARGARAIHAVASHGIFVGAANATMTSDAIDKILVTDTVPPFRLSPDLLKDKVVVLTATGLIAEAIRRISDGGSLVELLESRGQSR
jgi:ribose-phosphate pyrophosphokinase